MKPDVQQIPVPQLPAAPPPPPVMGQQPVGSKPARKSTTPTFLNSTAVPSKATAGTKQLVGQ